MKRPVNSEIFQDEQAEYWMEGDDLLCSVCKPQARTLEATKNAFKLIGEVTGGKTVYLLSEISSAGQGSHEVREFSIAAAPKHFKAMALITSSSFGALLGNMFLSLSRQPIPMKLFKEEKEAREWLDLHLRKHK
ncbi:MAG: STAS/SEC14 domain-containing protein [Bacteroidia bacterium]